MGGGRVDALLRAALVPPACFLFLVLVLAWLFGVISCGAGTASVFFVFGSGVDLAPR